MPDSLTRLLKPILPVLLFASFFILSPGRARASASFTLSLGSPTVALAQGAGTADLLTVNSVSGFSGSVSLSASGLPAGVGYTFYPSNPTSTSTNLVMYVSSSATPGSYSVTVNGTSGNLSASTPLTLVITGTQTISFPAIATQTANTTVALGATASSGLSVAYTSTTPTVCAVSAGNASLLSAGTCSITASQPGNAYYSAATAVSQSFTVNPATQTITFATIPTQTAGSSLVLTAKASSGLAVTYSASPASVCTISANTASLVSAGSCSITASQAGNAVYSAATAVSQTFTVNSAQSFTLSLASPTITLAQGNGATDLLTVNPLGGFNGSVALSVVGLPTNVNDAFSPSSSTSSNTQFVLYVQPTATPGPYTITLNGTSGSATASAKLTLNVTGTQTITFNALAAAPVGSSVTLSATASSGLPVTFSVVPNGNCSVSGNVVTLLNAGNCGVLANQAGNAYYAAAAQVEQILTVTQGPPTPAITWATPAAVAVGTKLSATQLNATASVPGTFAYSPASGTAMSAAGAQTLSVTFTPTDTVHYATTTASVTLVVVGSNASTINYGALNQTIRGFGGSTAWMPQLTANQANNLFGTNAGQLGLSILRVRIDPGGSGNWGTELANAQEAQARGASIMASPWTPPASMTSNGSTVGGTLNTSSYASYANYLASFAYYFANGGVPLVGISMQNEPDAKVTYESCVWTPAQMDAWVAGYASVLPTPLMMPESESFTASYSDAALNDSAAVGNISIVAGHLYGAKPAYYANAISKGKQVWMTEHYLNPSGAQPAIADALAAAKEVSDSLEVADYNAYLWWWVRDWNPGGGVTNYGLIDSNDNPTYYGLALGQFSRFIRPGYARATATYNPGSGSVYVTAYTGARNVIVAINMGTTAVSQQFVVQGQSISTLTPYQTSATNSITQLSGVTLTGNSFIYTLPAQSITTFVD